MRTLFLAGALLIAGCVQGEPAYVSGGPTGPVSLAPVSRCMNLGSALEAGFEGEWGYTVRQSDLFRIKDAGFDSVRLPVRWSGYASDDAPYTIDPDLFDRVDEILTWAHDAELKIIINVHHYDELNEDPDVHEPRLEAIWDQIAAHYAGAPNALIFETINEPHTKMSTRRTDALNARVLQRIRRDHPDRWVILGTAFWGNLSALEKSRPDYDPRVMLTYHEYSPFEFTHQGAPWTDQRRTGHDWGSRRDVARMMSNLDDALAVQDRTRMPVFIGEFGVYENVPTRYRTRWIRALRQGIEARGMSWCYWDFAGALKAYDTENETWIPELKSALLD